MHIPNVKTIGESNFLTYNAKKIFNYLWLTFIKALILQPFDLENHIRIETDKSGYAIGRVLSQLNLDFDVLLNDMKDLNLNKPDFGQWYLVAYFFGDDFYWNLI